MKMITGALFQTQLLGTHPGHLHQEVRQGPGPCTLTADVKSPEPTVNRPTLPPAHRSHLCPLLPSFKHGSFGCFENHDQSLGVDSLEEDGHRPWSAGFVTGGPWN